MLFKWKSLNNIIKKLLYKDTNVVVKRDYYRSASFHFETLKYLIRVLREPQSPYTLVVGDLNQAHR